MKDNMRKHYGFKKSIFSKSQCTDLAWKRLVNDSTREYRRTIDGDVLVDAEGHFYYRTAKKIQPKKVKPLKDVRIPVKWDKKYNQRIRREKNIWRRIKRLAGVLMLFAFLDWWSVFYYNMPEVQAITTDRLNKHEIEIDLTSDGFVAEDNGKIGYVVVGVEDEITQIVYDVFRNDARWALKCLMTENKTHDPSRINYNTDRARSVDVGVMQINAYWNCGKLGYDRMDPECIEALKDPRTNIEVGKMILDSQGKSAWYGSSCN